MVGLQQFAGGAFLAFLQWHKVGNGLFLAIAALVTILVLIPPGRSAPTDGDAAAKPDPTRPPVTQPPPPPPSGGVPSPPADTPRNDGVRLIPRDNEDGHGPATTVLFTILILLVTTIAFTLTAQKKGEGEFAPAAEGLRMWQFVPNAGVPANSFAVWDGSSESMDSWTSSKHGAEFAAGFAGWNKLAKPGPGGQEPKSQREIEDENLAAESLKASAFYNAQKRRREQQQQRQPSWDFGG